MRMSRDVVLCCLDENESFLRQDKEGMMTVE